MGSRHILYGLGIDNTDAAALAKTLLQTGETLHDYFFNGLVLPLGLFCLIRNYRC
jgi:hypothetical protein